jgi:hypothetical protein
MPDTKHTAGEQYLGYLYQARFALLRLFQLPEDNAVLIEMEDDLEFNNTAGTKTLASLKHKAIGDKLTNLSTDFWKSVGIWLERYLQNGKTECKLKFFLFTTAKVAKDSFLTCFLLDRSADHLVVNATNEALSQSKSQTIAPIRAVFDGLNESEKRDFLSRITILDDNLRIEEVPEKIMSQHMRTIRAEFRVPVFERLEGWWNNLVIQMLAKERVTEISGYEVSDKLASISDEFRKDNLPIDFGKARPEEVDPDKDDRLFVRQLKAIDVQANRIQNAILDYYRAFRQRSSWAREHLLLAGEIEEYEERLVSEWERYKDAILDSVTDQNSEAQLVSAGKAIYEWAELGTDKLRIRERVSEPYVVRGNYHILANQHPEPRVYWHPQFLQRLRSILIEATNENME